MSLTSVPSADDILAEEFQGALAKYPSLIQAVSDKKGAKDGQRTLADLDRYRYEEVVESLSKPSHTLDLEEVKKLVQWKLRHGKFRPTLMKLVSSNDPATTAATIGRALKHYRDKTDVGGALDILCELRGIGPATASLLLAVHEPKHVIFFGDEVFYWLCCKGTVQSAKYNAKEYAALHQNAAAVASRLGAAMVQIEQVAYVAMKQGEFPELMGACSDASASKVTPTAVGSHKIKSKELTPDTDSTAKTKTKGKIGVTAKRKETSDNEAEGATPRRSKRGCKGTRRR